MMNGDNQKAAKMTVEKLGISEYHADVFPEEKHSYVEHLKSDGRHVIIIGTGCSCHCSGKCFCCNE